MRWMEKIQLLIIIQEKKKKVFYVDIGAHHPIDRNNTQLLFQKGWKGINIEVDQFGIDLFNFLRPNDLNILSAVSNYDGKIDFYYQKKFSPLNTTSKTIANEYFNRNFNIYFFKKMMVLENCVQNTSFNPKKIMALLIKFYLS